jgi:hypothetical protein
MDRGFTQVSQEHMRSRFAADCFSALLVCIVLFSGGCENQPTEVEDYDPEPVLTAFLKRGEALEQVLLERIAAFDEYYDPKDHGIGNSSVCLFEIGSTDTLHLIEDPDQTGRYVPPPGEAWIPEGQRRYRIEAVLPNGRFMWSETTVPDSFDVYLNPDPALNDTLTRLDPPLTLSWTGAPAAGGYAMNIVCLSPEDSLVPLDPDFDPSDEDAEDDSLAQSGVWIMREDQRVLTVPWVVFYWEGPYRIDVMAVDVDYYDYVFAWFRVNQQVGVDLPSNIHGGMGIFAGLSRYTFHVYMKRVSGDG